MTRRSAVLPAVLLVLASGCATQPEDAQHSEPAGERELEEPGVEPTAEAIAPAEDEAPRGLAELERELASNNARLRELGVELPREQQDAQAEIGGEGGGTAKQASGGDSNATPSVSPAPAGKAITSKPDAAQKGTKKPRRDAKDKTGGTKPQDAELDTLDMDDGVRPEEAKAAPPSPTNDLDPVMRCQQVCDLAAISCGLGDEICELADRHPGESDYASACERANVDCEAAKEACDACAQ
jgi:hypothetical protein